MRVKLLDGAVLGAWKWSWWEANGKAAVGKARLGGSNTKSPNPWFYLKFSVAG